MDLLAALRKAGSKARLLVLTSETSEAHLRLAMSAGAHAYLLKEDGYSELLEALRVVNSGRRFFSDSVESTILRQYAERCAVRFSESAALITPRQREVLARIGQGQTNKVIANALRLSVKTVEKHRLQSDAQAGPAQHGGGHRVCDPSGTGQSGHRCHHPRGRRRGEELIGRASAHECARDGIGIATVAARPWICWWRCWSAS